MNQSASTPVMPQSSFPDLSLSAVKVTNGKFLPHWEARGAIYHVSFHLADSVPAKQLAEWREARRRIRELSTQEKRPFTPSEIEELKCLYNDKVERYLASGYGECLLSRAGVAEEVIKVFEYADGIRYALHTVAIMPNHVHVIAGGFGEKDSAMRLFEVWKRTSAHRINRQLGRSGPVWHQDSYSRIIRDAVEYRRQLNYVWSNPESAGLTAGFLRRRYVEW